MWGRGALDVKFSVTALLEAVTRLLAQGYQPKRTILITFGHDEEVRKCAQAARACCRASIPALALVSC